MKALGIIVNIFFPGIGTFFVKKIGQAIAQILLWIIGVILTATGVGGIIGIPLILIAWIWSLVSVATVQTQPMEIVVKQEVVSTQAEEKS